MKIYGSCPIMEASAVGYIGIRVGGGLNRHFVCQAGRRLLRIDILVNKINDEVSYLYKPLSK